MKAKLTSMQNDLNNTKKHHQKMESEYDGLQATIASQAEIIQVKEALITDLTKDINNAQEFVNNRNAVILSLQEKLSQATETETQLRESLQTVQDELGALKMTLAGSEHNPATSPVTNDVAGAASSASGGVEVIVPSHLVDLAENKDLMGLITELSKIGNVRTYKPFFYSVADNKLCRM